MATQNETFMSAGLRQQFKMWVSEAITRHNLRHSSCLNITDLPSAAQAKLMDRTQARETLGGQSDLINDDEQRLI